MANTATNVSVGKPAVAGGIYRAPLGTTLPTDATTALANTYVSLGYIAEGGVTNSNTITSETYKAWGGTIVLSYMTDKTDTFAFGLIEVLNPDVLSTVHGTANVSGTLATGITVKANASDPTEYVYVIEMLMRDNAVKRIVIPDGKISEIGDIVYSDTETAVYPITITAQAGSDGDTHKEYIKRASST